MDPQIVSSIVIVIITVAGFLNVDLDSGMLTEVVMALGVLVSAITVWYQRTTLQKAPGDIGDVTFAGTAR